MFLVNTELILIQKISMISIFIRNGYHKYEYRAKYIIVTRTSHSLDWYRYMFVNVLVHSGSVLLWIESRYLSNCRQQISTNAPWMCLERLLMKNLETSWRGYFDSRDERLHFKHYVYCSIVVSVVYSFYKFGLLSLDKGPQSYETISL